MTAVSHWIEGDLDADGVRLHFDRTGRGDKRPLVLVHGLSDNGLCWTRVASALESDFDVVMLDARNHGRSATAPATPDLLATDVLAVIDQLELKQPAVIGHSVGAHTAALLASNTNGLISHLVLEDPPWTAESELLDRTASDGANDRRAQIRTWLESLGGMSDTDMAQLGRTQHPDWPDDEFPSWIESNRQVRIEAAEGLARGPWAQIVTSIQCPTLLVHGSPERGGIVTPDVASRVIELNDHVTARAIENAGHNIRRENFEHYIHHVGAFLRTS